MRKVVNVFFVVLAVGSVVYGAHLKYRTSELPQQVAEEEPSINSLQGIEEEPDYFTDFTSNPD